MVEVKNGSYFTAALFLLWCNGETEQGHTLHGHCVLQREKAKTGIKHGTIHTVNCSAFTVPSDLRYTRSPSVWGMLWQHWNNHLRTLLPHSPWGPDMQRERNLTLCHSLLRSRHLHLHTILLNLHNNQRRYHVTPVLKHWGSGKVNNSLPKITKFSKGQREFGLMTTF